ncbi:MAG: glycerol-3-phosphate O-acyltransferase [Thermoleophilaceae bacterium]|nr:glycerol-3-phosphate O-acyltransferase [Thermoleophilaceae bacterium]
MVVLAEARSDTERELITTWAAREHPGAQVIAQNDPAIAARIDADPETLVVPARVTWLPKDARGDNRARLSDLVTLTDPRRPWAPVHKWIAARAPERARVTVGEPASGADLRKRFMSEAGTGGAAGLAAFVARQGLLACERSERVVIGDRYKVPRLVAEQITASASFRTKLAEVADKLNRPFDGVMDDAESCLEELATVQSPLAIDAFRAVMRPLHANAWTVEARTEEIESLREQNKKHALIFLPSHRSYVDPLVLAQVLTEHDFPRNHLLGGDNMSFWPIGPLGKRAGVIFIRRSFGDDLIYKLAVREYFSYLVAKRFNIEWYIEGGRTRTGKLRPPKYGLLHYLTQAFDAGGADDVLLVPTSISYDRQSEVRKVTEEQTGGTKQREGLAWMVDYIRAQRRNVGAARVRFGQPLSLRDALDEAGEGRARLEKVAFRICVGINEVTPVTPTSLATLALLGSRDRALNLAQMARLTAPLLDYTEQRAIPGEVQNLRKPAALAAVLDDLVEAGVADVYKGGTEPVWSIAQGGHHVAAFYRNGALHHFLNRAIIELAMLRVVDDHKAGGDVLDAGLDQALALRDLLKFEFFFADKRTFLAQLREELNVLAPDWEDRLKSEEGVATLWAEQKALVAHRALSSFIDAQLVVAERLEQRDPRQAIERDAFLKECLAIGHQMLLQGRLHGAEAVSRELFAGALDLAANRDLVDPGRDEVTAGRQAWLEELRAVRADLSKIDQMDRAVLEEVLHDGDG